MRSRAASAWPQAVAAENHLQHLLRTRAQEVRLRHQRDLLHAAAGAGTTSLAFINSQIQPTSQPKVFNTLNDVKQALQSHQIAALVTDTPTAQYMSSSEIPGSVMVAQFPSTGEHYGLVFSKGSPLVAYVDKALTTLRTNGTLASLHKKYLQIYLSVPTIKP